MTADKLHDAITLLPSDLIAEADRQRSAPRPVIRWQRYAAMAACFVLMLYGSMWCLYNLGSGGAKETAAEAPAAMQAQITMDAADSAAEEAAPAAAAQGSNSAAEIIHTPSVVFYIEGIPCALLKEEQAIAADLLLNLSYHKDDVCECIAEITAVTSDGTEYHINLAEGFVRCEKGQAELNKAQITALSEILDFVE